MFVAIVIVVLLGFVALVFDMGFIYVERAELQYAADSAALAAAEELPNPGAAQATALLYAAAQTEADDGVILKNSDIRHGYWDDVTSTFVPGGAPANAIQVTTRRSQVNGNPLGMAFAGVLGFSSVDVSASAIAARGVVDADVVILQDVTVSFVEEMGIAKDADKALVDTFAASYANDVRIGVVSFARGTVDDHPLEFLSGSTNTIKSAIDDMAICYSAGSPYGPCYGTDIGIGIDAAADMLLSSGRPEADKVIVLVSDGVPCIGEEPLSQWVSTGQSWATAAANAAGAAGINIFAITLYEPTSSSNPCSVADITFNESLARGYGFGATTTDPASLELLLTSVIEEFPVRLVR